VMSLDVFLLAMLLALFCQCTFGRMIVIAMIIRQTATRLGFCTPQLLHLRVAFTATATHTW
jgi:hypothetical protein